MILLQTLHIKPIYMYINTLMQIRRNWGENNTTKKFPTKDGELHEDRIIEYIPFTYYMGLLRKQNIKHYSTTDAMMSIPFVRSITSPDDFSNIMKFFHLVDNKFYPSKGSPGCMILLKKLGLLYKSLDTTTTFID